MGIAMILQRLGIPFGLAAGALLLAALTAGANDAGVMLACFRTVPSDEQIAACTDMIGWDEQPAKVRATAYVWRGNAYRDLRHDTVHAVADYDAAIALDPESVAGYFGRGNARRAAGDFDAALADYDQALVLWHRTSAFASPAADIHRARGDAYRGKGDLDGAIAAYDAALKLIRDEPAALYGRGLAKAKKGDQAGGDADVAAAKAINPAIAELLARWNAR
jgi:tetratricopeptide (TPR) repeat protein